MEAERAGGPVLVAVLEDMRTRLDEINARNVRADAAMEKLTAGFPDGDMESHRRYHEAVIERIELRNTMVRAALVKMAQAGGVAAFGWLGVAIWRAFKLSVTQ